MSNPKYIVNSVAKIYKGLGNRCTYGVIEKVFRTSDENGKAVDFYLVNGDLVTQEEIMETYIERSSIAG